MGTATSKALEGTCHEHLHIMQTAEAASSLSFMGGRLEISNAYLSQSKVELAKKVLFLRNLFETQDAMLKTQDAVVGRRTGS